MAGEGGRVRVLEVGLHWPPEPFLQRKLLGLVRSGFRVAVASPVRRRDIRPRLSGIRVRPLRPSTEWKVVAPFRIAWDALALAVTNPPLLVRLLRAAPSFRSLRNTLPVARERADVLHFEWEGVAVRFLPYLDALGLPVVVSCRGAGLNVYPHAGAEEVAASYPALFERATAVHCVSEAMCRKAVGHGLDPRKARVIRSGVDVDLFSPGEPRDGEDFCVISVARLHWLKGLEDGVRAVGLLAAEGRRVTYEIVGDDPEPTQTMKPSVRPQLLYLIHELELDGLVRLVGRVSHDAIRDRLRASDVLLQPSLSEGLPNTVLEAMACALPVVVTDRGGLPEAVSDGVEGFVRPARDPCALADALRMLCDDRELARRLGGAGRARILAEFGPELEREAHRRLYLEVVGRPT